MSVSLKQLLHEFIAQLRSAGVRVSVGESLDAMNAVSIAGIEFSRMREALRAALIKEAADDGIFELVFAHCFRGRPTAPGARPSNPGRGGVSGSGGAAGEGAATSPARAPFLHPNLARAIVLNRETAAASASLSSRESREAGRIGSEGRGPLARSSEALHKAADGAREERSASEHETVSATFASRGLGQVARRQAITEVPFSAYSELEYEEARNALEILKRRLRMRLGRRRRPARKGRIDFRRTIRAGIQRGGKFTDLSFRTRRPRHVDLLILGDISGSVRYASSLMLGIAAGARECFRRVTSLVYIDRIAEAGFEHGHLVMAPILDLYARSDLGRVLNELLDRHRDALNRATVIVIMGDGRNNRRPSRADLLREIRSRVRSVVWLNPEAPERWGTGDSAIKQYRRDVDALLYCGNLQALERALSRLL